MAKHPTLLSVQEAARILRVTTKTIRRWAQRSTLPGIKIGPRGDWRFSEEDLNSVIRRKGVET